MRMHVDAWDPAYGTGIEQSGDGPSTSSSAELDTDVEMPAGGWHPIVAPAGVCAPDAVLFVDGVRRIDARFSLESDDRSDPGIAASYAAGVVRCTLSKGVAEVVDQRVERKLFSCSQDLVDVGAAPMRYIAHRVERGGPNNLVNEMQTQMLLLEVQISSAERGPDDLLVVDGPLRGRGRLPNALGYVKTQRGEYLSDHLSSVVTALAAGQRSPIFLLDQVMRRYTWYLRLPSRAGAAWAGIVRIECSAELDIEAAVELANLSAATLPRFASVSYKDSRAPQNLVPIAGLERRLRARLGDARLLHRSLLRAAALTGAPV
jgi:uncharacterized protein